MNIHGEHTYYNLVHPVTGANIKVFQEIDIEGDFEEITWRQVFEDAEGNPMTQDRVDGKDYIYRDRMYFRRARPAGSGNYIGEIFDNGYEIQP